MKKIAFYGFLPNEKESLVSIVREKYDVEIFDDISSSDYLFIGAYDNHLELPFNSKQIRIFYTNEPCSFNIATMDYGVGFDYLSLIGKNGINRFLRYPYSYFSLYLYKDNSRLFGTSYEDAKKELDNKKGFCNFMYSHASPGGERESLFNALMRYKKVDSLGTFMNNMDDSFVIDRNHWEDKISYIHRYKFTICCEPIVRVGYNTEKIGHAFLANSIPIYLGDPLIAKDFNEKSFINANNFKNLDELVKYVEYVDTHDDVYIKMLQEPKLLSKDCLENEYFRFKNFIWNIFSMDLECALQRSIHLRDRWFYEDAAYFYQQNKKYSKLLRFPLKIFHFFRKKK